MPEDWYQYTNYPLNKWMFRADNWIGLIFIGIWDLVAVTVYRRLLSKRTTLPIRTANGSIDKNNKYIL